MKVLVDLEKQSVIEKRQWSVFYEMCLHHSEQDCFCEHVENPEKQKCLSCEAKKFLKCE
ncbi:MAG: hypothetical protein GY909_15455 [Oligoflexia bacterium]|nr:hypothetical protein [Oligoflexia bacterium]